MEDEELHVLYVHKVSIHQRGRWRLRQAKAIRTCARIVFTTQQSHGQRR